MRQRTTWFAAILAAIFLAACGGLSQSHSDATQRGAVPFDLSAMKKMIQENNDRFTAAHIRGDSALIDNMFARNGKVMPPQSEAVIGREAISKVTAEYIASGISEFKEETTDFYGNEDVLIDQGTYVVVYGKEKTKEAGKYLNVWRKEDGVWKIYANIWNTNAPPVK